MHGHVLKNKVVLEVTIAFESILKEDQVPQKLQTDWGKGFFNKRFHDVMEKYRIHHFATGSELKANVVECFNRTVYCRMWCSLTAVDSKRYIDVWQDLITSYKQSYQLKLSVWLTVGFW